MPAGAQTEEIIRFSCCFSAVTVISMYTWYMYMHLLIRKKSGLRNSSDEAEHQVRFTIFLSAVVGRFEVFF